MSKFTVKKFSEKDSIIWDKFVQDSVNGTIFHERKFINYHPIEKFNDNSLMFLEKDKLVAIFPAAIIEKESLKILKSHPGTSYGGLVFNKGLGIKDSYQLIEALEEYAKSSGFHQIEFRLCEKIFHKYPADEMEFALVRNNYERESEELSTCYDLEFLKGKSEEEAIKLFSNSGRSKVRQSLNQAIFKDFEFKFSDTEDEINEFYQILSKNLEKHNTKPVHTLEEIKKICTSYPDRALIALVKQNGKIISGIFALNINSLGWHIFYSALDYSHQNLRPQNYCLFRLMHKLAQDNNKYLNFGISTEQGGKFINWGLFEFKESFNGFGSIRTYWMKKL